MLYVLTSYRVLGIIYLDQLLGACHTHISYHNNGPLVFYLFSPLDSVYGPSSLCISFSLSFILFKFLFFFIIPGTSNFGRVRRAVQDVRGPHVFLVPRLHPLSVVDGLPRADSRHIDT